MPQTYIQRCLHRLALSLAVAGAALSQAPAAGAAPAPAKVDAREQVIYFVFTDRFKNGDRKNDFNVNPQDPHAYHGGDLAGLISELDYIKGLGVTTIWISPFNDNQDNAYMGKYWGYHGYWIQDFAKMDEHWGDEATLKRFVDAAHARGMRVLFDAIVNHTGYDAAMVKDPRFERWFHRNGGVSDWNNPYQNENYDVAGLPDLNTENAAVLTEMQRVWAEWIVKTGADGFRLDTVRHVPIAFWNVFNGHMKQRFGKDFFILGEVSYHDGRTYPPYLQGAALDALFDFPQFAAITEVFAQGKSARKLAETLKLDALYPDPGMMVPFLDSHDEMRFMTAAGNDEKKWRLAMTYLATLRGLPMFYQGIETAMPGGRDPDNRRDMAWGAHPERVDFTRRLIALRKSKPALSRGTMKTLFSDDTAYAFSRRHGGQEVLVALNTGKTRRSVSMPLTPDSPLKGGTVLRDHLSNRTATVGGHQLTVVLEPMSAAVLSPVSVSADAPRK